MTSMHARAEAMRMRMRLRAWETRQLRGAKGAWFRLRTMLSRAQAAYIVEASTFHTLEAEGYSKESVGDELEPHRCYLFVSAERAANLVDAQSIAVRLSAEFLAATHVVLVPF